MKVKHPPTAVRRLALAILASPTLLLAQSGPTPPSTPAPETTAPIKLNEFVVQTDQDRGYFSTNTEALRLNSELKKLPLPVTVLNQQYFQDLNKNNVDDLLYYTAAMSTDSTQSNMSAYIRGMPAGTGEASSRNNTQFRGFASTAGIERVEILKGPASLIHGVTHPGGKVNVIGMRAKWSDATVLRGQFGSYDSWVASFDTNQAVHEKLAVRALVEARRDGARYQRRHADLVSYNFNTVWRPLRKSEFELDVQHVRRESKGTSDSVNADFMINVANNTASMGKAPLFILYPQFPEDYNLIDESTVFTQHHTIPTLTWRQDWIEGLKTSLLLNHQFRSQQRISRAGSSVNTSGPVPTVSHGWQYNRGDEIRSWDAQFQAMYDFSVFGTRNKLSGFFSYAEAFHDFENYENAEIGANGQYVRDANGNPRRKTETYTLTPDLVISVPQNLDFGRTVSWRYDNQKNNLANLVHQAEIPTRFGTFNTLAGVNLARTAANGPAPGVTGIQSNANLQITNRTKPTNEHFLPSYGVVYAPKPNVQLWASHMRAIPSLGVSRNSFGDELPLRQAKSIEVGLRLQFLQERVAFMISAYDNLEYNRTYNDPGLFRINTEDINGRTPRDTGFDGTRLAPNTPLGDTIAAGEFNSKGWEMDLNLNLTQNFTARVEYAFIDAAVRKDINPALVGRRDNGNNEHAFTTVARYVFSEGRLRGFWFGGALRLTTERYHLENMGTVLGNVEMSRPGIRRLDLFGGYRFRVAGRNAGVQLNIDNALGDKRYVGAQAITLRPYGIRNDTTWRLSADMRF